MRTVADAIAETLGAYGVQYAFGIPGNDVLELIRACEERGIRFVLAKSEPSAAFMADAGYHLTRRPAALIAALGPGRQRRLGDRRRRAGAHAARRAGRRGGDAARGPLHAPG